MRFAIFYEHQLPRPWDPDAEHRLLREALEQVEIADRVGFDAVWEVEHHFLEEYSHSSASDVFLAAASQRTQRIRLGVGILPLPPGYQHPARVAETVATLDLVSDGRVEFGTGETSSGAELEGFGVDRATKRAQWEEALGVVTRMFVEEPFAGVDGRFVSMPQRNVVPKPLQKPHPLSGSPARAARRSASPPRRGSAPSASRSSSRRRRPSGSPSTARSSRPSAASPPGSPSTRASRSSCP